MKNEAQVYLIDDGADYRFMAEQVFTRFLPQYTPHFFSSGNVFCQYIFNHEAKDLALIGEHDASGPALILLDMHMPGLSGLQTLQEIRRHISWQHMPVVMMSNGSSQQDKDACYEAGANSFLDKPMGLIQLRQVLEIVCHYWLQINQAH